MNSKAGRNIEDTIKKVKKSSRIEVVNETTNNENPFFEVFNDTNLRPWPYLGKIM